VQAAVNWSTSFVNPDNSIGFTKNNEIYYSCKADNTPSAKTARRAGFKFLKKLRSSAPYLSRDTNEPYDYLYAIYAPNDPAQYTSWDEYIADPAQH
jgi:hypothetical protein